MTAEQLEIVASLKQLFASGIKLFNAKPIKGMQFFINNKFVEPDHQSIAFFLRSTPQLGKPAIGDFLGDGSAENIKIMRVFIDQLDFAGIDFVEALRLFLQSFRLPGEAQKIDRLMEKFADRYCEGNPTIFAKADTAYTLAFSVIMLNTDQHSNQIKHRMDKNAFIKNNRGINDEGDLPEEFLGAIFDEISNNEIVMEDEGKVAKISMGWGAGDLNETKRMEIYKKEVVTIQKKSHIAMTSSKRSVAAPFKTAIGRDLARPMFVLSSWAIMAALSLQFEASPHTKSLTQSRIVELCLSGFAGGVKISCLFNLETERDAYVTSLSKLTNLNNFQAITQKNISAIMTLVTVGQSLAEDMHKSWIHVVRAISQLEKMQTTILGNHELDTKSSNPSLKATPVTPLLIEFCKEMQSQTSIIVIDKIFTSSVNLTAPSIIQFFKAVCQVCLDEVGLDSSGKQVSSHPPRLYLLQKIVEISYYNMHRIRFEWTMIWRILQPHFNLVACHPNQNVATFAVDSLRQLGMKILEREELGHFSSQHEYLKSFEWIIKHTHSHPIRELILNSVLQMINAKAESIRSGWKSIFQALVKCAQTDDKMAIQAFSIIQMTFKKHFELLVSANVFVDLVSCLAEFALIKGQGVVHDEQVMGSIQLLQSCTKSLMHRAEDEIGIKARRSNVSIAHPSSAVMLTSPHAPLINNLPLQPYLMESGLVSEEHFYLSWFPILSAFSRVVCESDGVLVRTHTMETLFESLKCSGHLFGAIYWKAIHRNVISPIFDDLCESSNIESNAAVLILGLRLLVDLISLHFDIIIDRNEESTYEFLQQSLDSMVDMIGKRDEKVASTGQICFHQFLINNSDKLMRVKSLGWLVTRIERAFSMTLPWELVICELDSQAVPIPAQKESPAMAKTLLAARDAAHRFGKTLLLDQLNFEQTIIKCVTHLELIQTMREFCLTIIQVDGTSISCISQIQTEDRQRLLACVYSSYAMARAFNYNIPLRNAIYKRGWVPQLPNLVKQETVSLQTYLLMLFATLSSTTVENGVIIDETCDLMERCVDFVNDLNKNQRDLISWSPTLVLVYKEVIASSTHPTIAPHLPRFYKYAIKLMACDHPPLKNVLQEFLTQISDVLFDGPKWVSQ